jgi:hypothetical protein
MVSERGERGVCGEGALCSWEKGMLCSWEEKKAGMSSMITHYRI